MLSKICRQIYQNHANEIKDIILFGSSVRGKLMPSDLDILIVFANSINKDIEYELSKKLSSHVNNLSVISKTEKNYLDESFDAREGLLYEGYSIAKSRSIASGYGFKPFGFFIYNTNNLTNTKKTRFYYALNGRGENEGILGTFYGIKISDNLIAVPASHVDLAKSFFDSWEISYRYVPTLIPERLARKELLNKVS